MADPTRTNGNSGTASTSSVNASFGFTATSGRLLVLTVGSDDYRSGNPSGWTLSSEMEQQAFLGHTLWWKISDGSETSVTYVIGSATGSAWTIDEFDNVDPTPYDASEGQFTNTGGLTYTTPTITPSTGRRLLLASVGASRSPLSTMTDTNTWLNSFTEINQSSHALSATGDLIGIAMRVVDGDGSTGFSSGATYSATSEARTALIISFKVASDGPGSGSDTSRVDMTESTANLIAVGVIEETS